MKKILVCVNYRSNPSHASCARRGGREIADKLEDEVTSLGLALAVERFNCLGNCDEGPNIKLVPSGPYLTKVDPGRLDELLVKVCDFARNS